MRALVVTPAEAGSLTGNRVTAERWARRLGELGHEACVQTAWNGEVADLLIALHASKSHESVVRFSERCPGAPIVVGLAGTDLYADLDEGGAALDSLRRASRLVALQRLAVRRLPEDLRPGLRVIHQSAERAPAPASPSGEGFEVCVLAHLRGVKDPLLAARAARRLPIASGLRIRHAGRALDEALVGLARSEERENPRYRWLGPLPYAEARALLAGSRALVLCSSSEGGANVVSEAIVEGVPVLATRIDGSVGLLGDDHPGLFEVGDEKGLAELLWRLERDAVFRGELSSRCRALAPLFEPRAEREAWSNLLQELREA